MSQMTKEINAITGTIIGVSGKLIIYALVILLLVEGMTRGYAFGHEVVAKVGEKLIPVPFNLNTLRQVYGEEKAADWPHGRVFAGAVTPAFVQTLLTQPLPGEGTAVPRLTPFFSIFFDNGFSSEHYGTEVHIATEEDDP